MSCSRMSCILESPALGTLSPVRMHTAGARRVRCRRRAQRRSAGGVRARQASPPDGAPCGPGGTGASAQPRPFPSEPQPSPGRLRLRRRRVAGGALRSPGRRSRELPAGARGGSRAGSTPPCPTCTRGAPPASPPPCPPASPVAGIPPPPRRRGSFPRPRRTRTRRPPRSRRREPAPQCTLCRSRLGERRAAWAPTAGQVGRTAGARRRAGLGLRCGKEGR
mmetsp:Transcript_35121/g.113143  ORF Transcript_35121/g.113143 Transcript_35121/m.113143 type:complete len:221 (-) Transcript_35121:214-876(-)